MSPMRAEPRTPVRIDGYAPIRDYAAIGNKRTAALVALDGSIDWMPHPGLASPSLFASVLDARSGGRFALAPTTAFGARRRYVAGSNVLETTFETDDGTVRVTDAMSRPLASGLLWNQVVRRVDGVAGHVPMRWDVEPRFDYATVAVAPERRRGVPAFVHGDDVVVVETFDAGETEVSRHGVGGTFVAEAGNVAVVALSAFHGEPLTLSSKTHVLAQLEGTVERWQRWLSACTYEGPWHEAVLRSALALDLLADDETGAIAAAATMGLPERIGGARNFDYRYAWLRDMNLTLKAMLDLGFRDQVHVSLAWMLGAMRRTLPRLQPMYRLDGDPELPSRQLALDGYCGSRPVVVGNSAQTQLQLGNFGDVLAMARAYAADGGSLAPRAGVEIADLAEHAVRVWRQPDAGIWELSQRRHYTQSKLACWLALAQAAGLADAGEVPAGRAAAWRAEAAKVARYVHDHCWSEAHRSYARAAGDNGLDAGVLLATRGAFVTSDPLRLNATIDAIRRELGAGGALLYRYTGMQEEEGAFLACSFWLAEALARLGRLDEAAELMDSLVGLANDVGLYSEELDPSNGEFLGNLPQALTHLALINAATAIADRPAVSRPRRAASC